MKRMGGPQCLRKKGIQHAMEECDRVEEHPFDHKLWQRRPVMQ